jgi:hypothetical protein
MDDLNNKIAIRLCTCNRHEPLKEVLGRLSQIYIPEKTGVEFVLVDNDENA